MLTLVAAYSMSSTAPNTIAERVVAHDAGLQLAQSGATEPRDRTDAVHRAVDDALVDAVAEEARERGDRAAHQTTQTEVDVVRVGENVGERRRAAVRPGRSRRG